MQLRILHTNDLHGKLTTDKLPFLLSLREEADLYFDTGDCLRTGNLGVPFRKDPVWEDLSEAQCTASVIGNRETHVLESVFRSKLSGSAHPVLCANLANRAGDKPLPSSLKIQVGEIRIGVVGVSVPMVTERMKTQAASAYLWSDPIKAAIDEGAKLRGEVDLLIALTHIGHAQDRRLAEATDLFEVIFGGHSHTVLERPELVNRTWICQGGSHARYVGDYVWDGSTLSGGLAAWPKAP